MRFPLIRPAEASPLCASAGFFFFKALKFFAFLKDFRVSISETPNVRNKGNNALLRCEHTGHKAPRILIQKNYMFEMIKKDSLCSCREILNN